MAFPIERLRPMVPESLFESSIIDPGFLPRAIIDPAFSPRAIIDPVYSGGGRAIIDPVYSGGGRAIIDPVYSGGGRGIIDPVYSGGGRGIISPSFQEGGQAIISPSFAMEPSSSPSPVSFPGMSPTQSLRYRPSPIQQWEPLVYHRYDSYEPRPFFLPRSAVKPSTVTPMYPNLF